MAASETALSNTPSMSRPDIDYLVLREAQKTVSLQTRHVTLGLFFIVGIAAFSLKNTVPLAYTAVWALPLLGAMAARAARAWPAARTG